MANTPSDRDDGFAQVDKQRTGNAVNARTDDMKIKLDSETDRLRENYVDKDDDRERPGS